MKTLEELEKELILQKEKINNSLIDLKAIEDEIILLKDKAVNNRVKAVDRLEKYQKYYYIGANFRRLIIDEDKESHHVADDNSYSQNNYFQTKEEAERYLKHFLLQLELLRLRDKLNGDFDYINKNNKKYVIEYNIDQKHIHLDYYTGYLTTHLYFKSPKIRQEFIDIIGKEKIIQYLTS